jgi:hypothetical protein
MLKSPQSIVAVSLVAVFIAGPLPQIVELLSEIHPPTNSGAMRRRSANRNTAPVTWAMTTFLE